MVGTWVSEPVFKALLTLVQHLVGNTSTVSEAQCCDLEGWSAVTSSFDFYLLFGLGPIRQTGGKGSTPRSHIASLQCCCSSAARRYHWHMCPHWQFPVHHWEMDARALDDSDAGTYTWSCEQIFTCLTAYVDLQRSRFQFRQLSTGARAILGKPIKTLGTKTPGDLPMISWQLCRHYWLDHRIVSADYCSSVHFHQSWCLVRCLIFEIQIYFADHATLLILNIYTLSCIEVG